MIQILIIITAIYFYRQYKKANPTLTPEEKLRIEKEQIAQNARELEEKIRRESELKMAREGMLENFDRSDSRVYFCHSFINEESEIYPIDGFNNDVISEVKTNLKKLYSQGFRLKKAEKTGASAQLDAFNFLLYLERDEQKAVIPKAVKKTPSAPPLPPPPIKKA